ncbi:hypothetical protein [Komagataeibacter sp. FNDCF1]|uniref:hypothetical protein n=1 Tax=Komagataeibacter sp. FNDCF1 TaxID=2878681 RepID=UPI001E2E2F81|nr:hypothetical protein [Komagataeibacter sp. FNDCF1]MCE2563687.1 hypothetical protein [Komagataeibacter sp. FNDCF1]
MDNPLETSAKTQARITTKAKEMWVADGKPGCGPEAYTEAASELIGMESNPDAGQIPVESPVPLDENGQPVEQAWVEENLGNSGGSQDELDDRREVPFADRKEEAEALRNQ